MLNNILLRQWKMLRNTLQVLFSDKVELSSLVVPESLHFLLFDDYLRHIEI